MSNQAIKVAVLALLSVASVSLLSCSRDAVVAVFTVPPGASRGIPLGEDVPVITARLHALGDALATVSVQGNTVVVKGGGPLPAPPSFFVETGRLTVRPAFCAAPQYSLPRGPSIPNRVLPNCAPGSAMTAANLEVNPSTGQPRYQSPEDPGFTTYPSNPEDDANQPSTEVLLANNPSATGLPYSRLVLGPAQVVNSVASAKAAFVKPSWLVNVTLTPSGAREWNALASFWFHAYVAVDIDAKVMTVPLIEPTNVAFASFGNQLQIAANFTRVSALRLAALLSAGPLRAPLAPASDTNGIRSP